MQESIPVWEENLKLVRAGEKLDLPKDMERRNKQLVEYADLRVRELRLALDAAEGRPGQDSLQMVIHERINTVLESLNKE